MFCKKIMFSNLSKLLSTRRLTVLSLPLLQVKKVVLPEKLNIIVNCVRLPKRDYLFFHLIFSCPKLSNFIVVVPMVLDQKTVYV